MRKSDWREVEIRGQDMTIEEYLALIAKDKAANVGFLSRYEDVFRMFLDKTVSKKVVEMYYDKIVYLELFLKLTNFNPLTSRYATCTPLHLLKKYDLKALIKAPYYIHKDHFDVGSLNYILENGGKFIYKGF